MNNQKGMALVTVLLTIVITMLLLATLTSMIISTGEQTQRTQENIQADSLAKMGQEYIFTSFESAKEKASGEEAIEVIMNEWKDENTSTERSLGEGRYIVTVDESETSDEPFAYDYESRGIVDGQEELIEGTLTVIEEVTELTWEERVINEKNEIENSFTDENKVDACDGTKNNDEFESDDYWLTLEECTKGANEDLVFAEGSRLWVQGALEMKGNNSITINGFTYFQLSDLYMNGGNRIVVNGDAFLDAGDLNADMKNNTSISISGDAYFENAHPGTLAELNICVDGNTNVDNITSCRG